LKIVDSTQKSRKIVILRPNASGNRVPNRLADPFFECRADRALDFASILLQKT